MGVLLPLLLALLPTSGADELDRALASLSSPSAEERRAAEVWLAGRVRLEDGPQLARAALDGDAEVRLRVARVLGASEHGLALSLAVEAVSRELAPVGAAGLRARALAWNPALGRLPRTGSELLRAVEEASRRSWPETLRLELDAPLGEVCGRLARHADLPIGLAVDPAAAELAPPIGRPVVLVGTWGELVLEVARQYGARVEGYGFPEEMSVVLPGERPPLVQAFLLLAKEGAELAEGAEVLASWCRTVRTARTGDGEPARRGAARALAASRWPEALRWLGARALPALEADLPADRPLPPSLAGVLLGASHGRLDPGLARADVVRSLIRLVERGRLPGAPPEEAELTGETVEALRGLPGVLAEPDGGFRRTAEVLAEGWGEAGPTGRWVRLVALEALGAPEGRAPARATLEEPAAGAPLHVAAVRCRAAAHAGAPGAPDPVAVVPGALVELLPALVAGEGVQRSARLLERAEVGVPPEWLDPGGLPADLAPGPLAALRAVVLLQLALAADEAALAAHWRAALEVLEPLDTGQLLAIPIEELARETGPTWEAAWRAARSGRLDVDRSALLAGIVPAGEREAVARALLEAADAAGETDLALLGVVAGWGRTPLAASAQARLTALLRDSLKGSAPDPAKVRPVLAAVQRAVDGLGRGGLLPEGEDGREAVLSGAIPLRDLWRRDLRRAVTGGGRATLGLDPGWPRPSPPRIVDLQTLDRRLP